MRLKTLWLLIVLASLAFTLVPAQAAPGAIPVTQTNLLANPDLESFSNGVATSWEAWWESIANPGNGSLDYAAKPDFVSEANSTFVKSGGASQHIGHSWDPWHAGIRQTIGVAPGSVVHVTAWARLFASTPDFPAPSDSSVQGRMQVGVEPNGSIEWYSGTVRWSGTVNPHDTWAQVSVDATVGTAGKVTIFLSTNYRGDSRYHLDAWWDSVSATIVGAPANTPAPGATNPPANTPASAPTSPPPAATVFRTPTPGADGNIVYVVQPDDTLWRIAAITGVTVDQIKALNGLSNDFITVGQRLIIAQASAPAATPTSPAAATTSGEATPAATSGGEATSEPINPTVANTPAAVATEPAGTGTVCALLWNDTNGNGVRDTNEGLLPGGRLTVVDIATGAPVQTHTTDGLSEPHCFADLPAGQYTISSVAPTGYNATTVTATPLQVEAGSTSTLEFGAQPGASAPVPTPGGGNRILRTALFGAAGIMFLLLAAGVAAFLFVRRPG